MTREDRSVLGLPLALSSGLHFLVFALVVIWLAAPPAGIARPRERSDLVRLTTTFSIDRRVAATSRMHGRVVARILRAAPAETPVRLAAAHRRIVAPHPATARREAVATQARPQSSSRARFVPAQRLPTALEPARAAARPQTVAFRVRAVVNAARPPASDPAPAAATGMNAPLPTTAPALTSAVAHVTVEAGEPAGGWGQTFAKPLLVDESVLAQLRAKYHIGAIVVHVDEAGRATQIDMAAGVTEEAHAEIERVLLSARFVPAECNGLRCEGALDLVV